MAQRQRGKTITSVQVDQNRAGMENLNEELSNSDDEAPEEVTFEDSKTRALACVKVALEADRREKDLLKEKRRRRHELFQQQKRRKLLPPHLLDKIDSSPPKKKTDSSAEAPGEEAVKEKKTRASVKAARTLKGNYKVRTLKPPKLASIQQKNAMDFIQSRLYGPGTCRTTSCELLSLHNKTGQNKSAAVDFVKKDWAPSLKAKSEKVKKRWLHQQLV